MLAMVPASFDPLIGSVVDVTALEDVGLLGLFFVELSMQNFPVKRRTQYCYKNHDNPIVGEPEVITKSSSLGPLELNFQVPIGHVMDDHAE